jgi:hypothetical protein
MTTDAEIRADLAEIGAKTADGLADAYVTAMGDYFKSAMTESGRGADHFRGAAAGMLVAAVYARDMAERLRGRDETDGLTLRLMNGGRA